MAQLQDSVTLTSIFRTREAAPSVDNATHPAHSGNTPRWRVKPGQVALAVILTLTYGSLAYLLSHLAS